MRTEGSDVELGVNYVKSLHNKELRSYPDASNLEPSAEELPPGFDQYILVNIWSLYEAFEDISSNGTAVLTEHPQNWKI